MPEPAPITPRSRCFKANRTKGGLIALLGPWAMLSACTPPVASGGFDAPDPASRIYAAQRAAVSGDQSAVPHIVELLDSDDPAVRFTAIGALKRLTGETLGYDYSAGPAERRLAIDRWVDYVNRSDMTVDSADNPS